MVLQNRLDFKDSQRLLQRPGADFLFRVFAFKFSVSITVNYALCTIYTQCTEYILDILH